jgi:DNA-binding PucR family transcriptional regulator
MNSVEPLEDTRRTMERRRRPPAETDPAGALPVGALEQLRSHRPEIEELIFARVREATAEQLPDAAAADTVGLREVVADVLDYGLMGAERSRRSPEERLAELVRGLLAGASVKSIELGYELDAWHLGVIATGPRAGAILRELAVGLGRPLLRVPSGSETVWAWFGGQRKLAIEELKDLLSAIQPAGFSLATGEPARGTEGWRLTHRQARAALLVALRRPQRLTRFAEVGLLALALGDEALSRSLVEIYLSPFHEERDGGAGLRRAVRAYFAADHNAKAAACALGVDRGTLRNRLRTVEERLGFPLNRCQAELEVALRLEELHQPTCDPPDESKEFIR